MEFAALPVISRRRLAFPLVGTHLFQSLRRAVAIVGVAAVQEALHGVRVQAQALRLYVRSVLTPHSRPLVPVQAQPAQAVENRLHGAGDGAHDVRILDAQYELASSVPGVQPVEQRGPDVADVWMSGGTGRITYPDIRHVRPRHGHGGG